MQRQVDGKGSTTWLVGSDSLQNKRRFNFNFLAWTRTTHLCHQAWTMGRPLERLGSHPSCGRRTRAAALALTALS